MTDVSGSLAANQAKKNQPTVECDFLSESFLPCLGLMCDTRKLRRAFAHESLLLCHSDGVSNSSNYHAAR
jgi:hypothetical protein